jgi:hypothetical protein
MSTDRTGTLTFPLFACIVIHMVLLKRFDKII